MIKVYYKNEGDDPEDEVREYPLTADGWNGLMLLDTAIRLERGVVDLGNGYEFDWDVDVIGTSASLGEAIITAIDDLLQRPALSNVGKEGGVDMFRREHADDVFDRIPDVLDAADTSPSSFFELVEWASRRW